MMPMERTRLAPWAIPRSVLEATGGRVTLELVLAPTRIDPDEGWKEVRDARHASVTERRERDERQGAKRKVGIGTVRSIASAFRTVFNTIIPGDCIRSHA
jgi:hypothetical protein